MSNVDQSAFASARLELVKACQDWGSIPMCTHEVCKFAARFLQAEVGIFL